MSFRFFLTERITIERNTPTKDASGGQADSWSAIATSIRAKGWNRTPQADINTDFMQREFKGNYVFAIDAALDIKPKDRIKQGSIYFEVHQVANFSHSAISSQTVYIIDCSLRTI